MKNGYLLGPKAQGARETNGTKRRFDPHRTNTHQNLICLFQLDCRPKPLRPRTNVSTGKPEPNTIGESLSKLIPWQDEIHQPPSEFGSNKNLLRFDLPCSHLDSNASTISCSSLASTIDDEKRRGIKAETKIVERTHQIRNFNREQV